VKAALDTNVLAYAEGINEASKRDAALGLIARLPPDGAVVPAQVLGELFNVLSRKAGYSPSVARDRLLNWTDAFPVLETSREAILTAANLAADHHLGIWDAIILCTAAQAGCRLLLSEDLQDGFTWGGITVVNPFAATENELLCALLKPE
jgi:predicted nucleic acid-binding protein